MRWLPVFFALFTAQKIASGNVIPLLCTILSPTSDLETIRQTIRWSTCGRKFRLLSLSFRGVIWNKDTCRPPCWVSLWLWLSSPRRWHCCQAEKSFGHPADPKNSNAALPSWRTLSSSTPYKNRLITIVMCATTLWWLFGSRCKLPPNSSPELSDFCRCVIHSMLRLPFLTCFCISAAK